MILVNHVSLCCSPHSADRNGYFANSPTPSYLPPSDSFIVVSLSSYRNMYMYTYTTSTLHMRIHLTFLNAPSPHTPCGSSCRRLGTVSRRSRRGCHSYQEQAGPLSLFGERAASMRLTQSELARRTFGSALLRPRWIWPPFYAPLVKAPNHYSLGVSDSWK